MYRLLNEYHTIDHEGKRIKVEIYRRHDGKIEVNIEGNMGIMLNNQDLK